MILLVSAVVLVREVRNALIFVSGFCTTRQIVMHLRIYLRNRKVGFIVIFEVDLAVWHVSKWHEVINLALINTSQLFHVLFDVFAVAEL